MLEAAQAVAPECFVVLQPITDRAQRPRVQFADPRGAVSPADDQTDGPQQTKVLRDRRPAAAKIGGNLAHRAASTPQQGQNFAPGRIGDRPEYGLASLVPSGHQLRYLLVTNNVTIRLLICQAPG